MPVPSEIDVGHDPDQSPGHDGGRGPDPTLPEETATAREAGSETTTEEIPVMTIETVIAIVIETGTGTTTGGKTATQTDTATMSGATGNEALRLTLIGTNVGG